MGKGRIAFWLVSFAICILIISGCKKAENRPPEEKKEPINVYCLDELKPDIKSMIEKSSLGDTHKVVFSDDKEKSELILTDKILASDEGYEKIAFSPIIVAFDNNKEKRAKYKKKGYIIVENDMYTINFDKIIDDTISGKWKEKIYCPELDTKEGQVFFDFLIINSNNGIYPRNEQEMQKATQKANQFMNCKVVLQVDSADRLRIKKHVKDELYIILEKNIYNIETDKYGFDICYPSNTTCYEVYFKVQDENVEELKKIIERKRFFETSPNLEWKMRKKCYRVSSYIKAKNTDSYAESDSFSYVEVPLKEE